MSSVTVVATAEPNNVPPRIRLDVTDTGTSPSIFAATVVRLNPDGSSVPVRTLDGNPLTLTTSGANRVGLVYDYEAPAGQPVTFSTVESPGNVSAAVTLSMASAWLVHVGVPALSMPVDFRADSFAEEEWGVNQGVHWPMGRPNPVVQTDGTRRAPASSVTVAIDTLTDLANLRTLLSDASTLYLNVPASLGYGVDSCYVAVGSVRNRRLSNIGSAPQRNVELPFQIVDRPAGGSQSLRTYADLIAGNASYSALTAKYGTYFDVLAGP